MFPLIERFLFTAAIFPSQEVNFRFCRNFVEIAAMCNFVSVRN